jgi:hypothetical protein
VKRRGAAVLLVVFAAAFVAGCATKKDWCPPKRAGTTLEAALRA